MTEEVLNKGKELQRKLERLREFNENVKRGQHTLYHEIATEHPKVSKFVEEVIVDLRTKDIELQIAVIEAELAAL